MRLLNLLGICVFGAAAQRISFGTPSFNLPNETLSADYGNISVSPPGRVLPLSVPVQPPRIRISAGRITGPPFLLLVVDPDAPRPYVLHWLQTDLSPRLTTDTTKVTSFNVTSLTLSSNTPALAAYRAPHPPAGDGPHRYVFLLFSQPANFSIPADFASFVGPEASRQAFNLTRFVTKTGLGKPVAGNYFVAENSTAADPNAATSSGSATSSSNATTGSSNATGSSNTTSRGTGAILSATALPYTGGAATIQVASSLAIISGLSAVFIMALI